MAIAAGLFAGAVFFYLTKTTASKGSDLLDDVKRLGEVRRVTVDGKQILDKRYFCNLSAIVTFH